LLSQPWHLLSPVVTRAVLAASLSDQGKEGAKAVLAAVFAQREQYILVNHCSGPNLDLSVRAVLARIEAATGLPVSALFERPELMAAMKTRRATPARMASTARPPSWWTGWWWPTWAVATRWKPGSATSAWPKARSCRKRAANACSYRKRAAKPRKEVWALTTRMPDSTRAAPTTKRGSSGSLSSSTPKATPDKGVKKVNTPRREAR